MSDPKDQNIEQEEKEPAVNEAELQAKDAQRRTFDEATDFVENMEVPNAPSSLPKVPEPPVVLVSDVALDDMESELVNHQCVQQAVSDGAYVIRPMDYDPEAEKAKRLREAFLDKLNTYRQKAYELNIDKESIEEATKQASADNVKSFKDFMDLVNKCTIRSKQSESLSDDELYFAQLKAAQDIERLRKLPNAGEELNKRIYSTYNTTAVKSVDMLKMVESDSFDKDVLQLEIYQKPIYSLILNVESDWFKELVDTLLLRWEDNATVIDIVDGYIASLNGGTVNPDTIEDERKALLKVLPTHILNENSPDMYKAYKAVCIIKGNDVSDKDDAFTSEDFSKKLLENADIGMDFAADVNVAMEDGDPFLAATQEAADNAAESMSLKQKIAERAVAQFINSVQSKEAKSGALDELVKAFVSEDTYNQYLDAKDIYDATAGERREKKEQVRAEKRIRRETRQEEKHQRAMDKMDREIERLNKEQELAAAEAAVAATQQAAKPQPQNIQQQYAQQPYPQQQPGRFGNRYNNQYGYGNNMYGSPYGNNRFPYGGTNRYGGMNYGPQRIPMIVVGVLVNIILGLISYILLDGFMAILAIVGLVVSCVGWYKQKINESGAMFVLIGGYLLFIVVFVLNFYKR